MMKPNLKPRGLTMMELVIVVAILAILAGAIVPSVSHFTAEAKVTATKTSLTEIRNAIMGTPETAGFLADTGRLPNSVGELFNRPADLLSFNRDTRRGWNGPYLVNPNLFKAHPTNA